MPPGPRQVCSALPRSLVAPDRAGQESEALISRRRTLRASGALKVDRVPALACLLATHVRHGIDEGLRVSARRLPECDPDLKAELEGDVAPYARVSR